MLSLCLSAVTWAPVAQVPIFRRYCRLGSSSLSSIQMTLQAKWSLLPGGCEADAMTSPRLASTSSAKVRVTAWPARADSRSPPRVTIRATVASRLPGQTRTASPGETRPDAIVPANPRNAESRRLTHWTGIRNGCASQPPGTSAASSAPRIVSPAYQLVSSERAATFAPVSAETGMLSTPANPRSAANSR